MARAGEGWKEGAWDGPELGGVLEPEEGRGGARGPGPEAPGREAPVSGPSHRVKEHRCVSGSRSSVCAFVGVCM